jgi:hypothetical protein
MKLWRNNEIKKITIIFGILLLVTLLFSFIASSIIINDYQNYFLNYNARVLSIITDKYPEVDDKVIDAILNTKKIYQIVI